MASPPEGRPMAVLRLFAERMSVSAADIGDELGLSSSAVYRHLAQMQAAGFVTRIPGGEFAAGPAALGLAESYRSRVLTDDSVLETLEGLARDTGELAAYLVRDGNTVLCVESVEGTRVLRCCYAPGRSQPLNRGASAVAILVQLDAAERDSVFRGLRLTRRDRAEAELAVQRARERGYATSTGTIDAGVWGISVPAPVRGRITAALTVMAPEVRSGREAEIAVSLRHAAAKLRGAHA